MNFKKVLAIIQNSCIQSDCMHFKIHTFMQNVFIDEFTNEFSRSPISLYSVIIRLIAI